MHVGAASIGRHSGAGQSGRGTGRDKASHTHSPVHQLRQLGGHMSKGTRRHKSTQAALPLTHKSLQRVALEQLQPTAARVF